MPENVLQVDLTQLEQLAVAHQRAADSCAAVRAEHPQAVAKAESWGPWFAEAKEAWTGVVNGREATLRGQQQWQEHTVAGIRTAHGNLKQMHERNTAELAGFAQVGGSGYGSNDARSGGGDSSQGTGPITNAQIGGGQWERVTYPSGQRP